MRYFLTPQMQAEWEANGELARINELADFGPPEIILVTPEQLSLIEHLREAIAISRGPALYGQKFDEKPIRSLMFSMQSAESAIKEARKTNSSCTLFEATRILQHSKIIPYCFDWENSLNFFNEAAAALLSGDEEFFQNVAAVLHRGLNKGPDDRWTIYIQKAFFELLGVSPEIIPTKKSVRELATYKHAIDDLWNRVDKSKYSTKQAFVDANSNVIRLEEKKLANLNPDKEYKEWTRRFVKAGLEQF